MSNLGSLKLKLEETQANLRRFETALSAMSQVQSMGVLQEEDKTPFCQIAGGMLINAWQLQRTVGAIEAEVTKLTPPSKKKAAAPRK